MNSNDREDMNINNRLRLCILSGDNDEAQKILEELDPFNSIDSSGQTLLHVAAKFNNEIITNYLIDRGCKVDAADNNGNTPLILACQQNNTSVIKTLVEAKASVLISNDEGKSAAEIILGGAEVNIYIVNSVLERVKEECSNDSLGTAKELLRVRCSLTRAMRLTDTAITEYMLDNGCDINGQDHPLEEWTPLHQAIFCKDNENVKLLIDRGADVNVEDFDGLTPVCHTYNVEILELLLDRGAKVVDDDGTLVVPELFNYWKKEVVEMLIEQYNIVDLSMKDRYGTTLFHHLASNQTFDPVEILQKHFNSSIDINHKSRYGFTVLLKTVREGNVRTVEFLLKLGAKFSTKDVLHDEVYYATTEYCWKENQKNREKIMMLLLQYGADIQWSSGDDIGDEYCTLDLALRDNHFAMAKIILARLALVKDLGVEIKNVYREKIEDNAMCKKYFEFCKRTIEKMKRTMIKRRMTLFDFMTCSEEILVKFARSEEFVETVQSMIYHKRNSNLYYYKVLRKRAKKAVEIVDLRKNTSWVINFLMPELQSNRIIIKEIVEYIIYDYLCIMVWQPTFKCITDEE